MALRHVPGVVEEEEDEVTTDVVLYEEALHGEVVTEKADEVEDDEVDPRELNIGVLTVINDDFMNDAADAVATVLIKNLEEDEFSEEVKRYIYEQVFDGVYYGIDTADLSKEQFETWLEWEN